MSFRYKAFISYRHLEEDRKWAKWLINRLETYKTPNHLVQEGVTSSFGRIFRDDDEIPADFSLDDTLENELQKSEFLIVICSPDTPKSKWVRQEIELFQQMGRGDKIIPLLIRGEPDESFPLELRRTLIRQEKTDGSIEEFWKEIEPLAADVRKRSDESEKETINRAFIRIAASLLKVRYDDLAQREKERAIKRKRYILTMITILIITITTLTTLTSITQFNNTRQEARNLSALLTDESLQALENGDVERAIKLSVVASYDTILSPAYEGAQFQLGIASRASFKPQSLEQHSKAIYQAQLWNDDKYILTASNDNTARIWMRQNNNEWTSEVLAGHSGPIYSAIFSSDFTKILTSSGDKTAIVWEKINNKGWLPTKRYQHKTPLRNAFFTANDQYILTISFDGEIRIHNQSNNRSETLLTSSNLDRYSVFSQGLVAAKIDPTGSSFLTSYMNGNVNVWSRNSQENWSDWSVHTLLGHSSIVGSLQFSNDGSKILTGSVDKTARIWQKNKIGDWESTILQGHDAPVISAKFSPDDNQIVTASQDNTARVWSKNVNNTWSSEVLNGHQDFLSSAEFSSDGLSIVTSSYDNTVRYWKKNNSNKWDSAVLQAHKSNVLGAVFSASGKNILSFSDDGQALFWNLNNLFRNKPKELDQNGVAEYNNSITSMTMSGTGKNFLTSSGIGQIDLWNQPEQNVWNRIKTFSTNNYLVDEATISSDGTVIIAGDERGKLHIWEKEKNGDWSFKKIDAHESRVSTVDLSTKNGLSILSAGFGAVKIWKRSVSGEWFSKTIGNFEGEIPRARYSSDGNDVLVSTNAKNYAEIFNLNNNNDEFESSVRLSGHTSNLNGAEYSKNGNYIVTFSNDQYARVWNKNLVNVWTSTVLPTAKNVTKAVFSPNNNYLATISLNRSTIIDGFLAEDREVSIWYRLNNKWLPQTLKDVTKEIRDITFSSDGTQLFISVGGSVGEIKIYDISMLLDDQSRIYAKKINPNFVFQNIINEVCENQLSSTQKVSDTGTLSFYYKLGNLTEQDIENTPIYRSLGLEVGDNVCTIQPSSFDKLVTWLFKDL